MTKKLLALSCFLFIIFVVSCEKEEWTSLELNQNECELTAIIGQFGDEIGIVKKADLGFEMMYIELSEDNPFEMQLNLIPCNLDLSQLSEDTRIKASGIVSYYYEEIPNSSEYGFKLVQLSKAQIE